jgi:phospholipase C
LRTGAALAGGLALAADPLQAIASSTAASQACGSLKDIEHVVFIMLENRSFDHYFGAFPGVRGFGDPKVRKQANGRSVFFQPDPANASNPPAGYLLPYHLQEVAGTSRPCTLDPTHSWVPQHQSWNGGKMDGFARAHRATAGVSQPELVMGYYDRRDLPFHYALADAFTICDHYFCSVLGPTDPNRLYAFTGTIDPAGTHGGPHITTPVGDRPRLHGRFTWTTMPEQLEQRKISWKVYGTPDGRTFMDVLPYFAPYQDPASPLHQKAFNPSFPLDLLSDVQAGELPAVSWIIESYFSSEHPPAPIEYGEDVVHTVLKALFANPRLWAKSAVFVTYDENGGFFDHVSPPVASPGTKGEYLTAAPVLDPGAAGTPPIQGPIGLGFRVPLLILSPFSRGGFVASHRYDHTSLLRFLETRFGAEVPNLTAWRRKAVGDLTEAFNFARPDYSIPHLPATHPFNQQEFTTCSTIEAEKGQTLPQPQRLPKVRKRTPRQPSGACR